MKTGRVRQKEPPASVQSAAADGSGTLEPVQPPLGSASPMPSGPAPRPGIPIGLIVAGVAGLALVLILLLVLSRGGGTQQWVPAARADGSWTTKVVVFGPQVSVVEGWQADCANKPNATLRSETCTLRDSDRYQDNVVDQYEEFAFNIYHEESWDKVYQAQGTEFVPTSLGGDDRWEGNRHTTRQEQLDKGTCTQSNYTVWVDDPNDTAQEVEVYLSECEVWNQVTVTERVYEQQPWCQCAVTSIVPLGQVSEQGAGSGIVWPASRAPSDGRTEQEFSGQVTFVGEDYRYTVTTADPNEYERLLTGQYYIGVKGDRPVGISDTPPSSKE